MCLHHGYVKCVYSNNEDKLKWYKVMDELKQFLTKEEYASVLELARFMIMPDPTRFVELTRQDGVKFIVHSNEKCGHHKVHVHIECGDAEYVLSIPEANILAASGKISKFKLKKAQEYVKDNSAFFAEGWNKYTNWIKISA